MIASMKVQSRHEWFPIAAGAAVVAIILITVITVYPSQGKAKVTPAASHSTSNPPADEMALSTNNYNSSLGVNLALSISNSTVWQDDGISVRISLNNTLATQNTITPPVSASADSQIPSWNLLICSRYPIGVQIFSGNYSLDNLSQGTSLNLIAPYSGAGCAGHSPVPITLAPFSDDIVLPRDFGVNQSAANIEFWGSWGSVIFPPSNNREFNSFTPGVYTIEGEDWWGQETILHFQVVPNPNPLDCATIASNHSYVEGRNFSASPGPLKLERYYEDMQSNNTVALALTTTGTSSLTVGMMSLHNPYTNETNYVEGPFSFSPSSNLSPQTWQYYSPNGTLSDPAVFFPNECSIVKVDFPASYQGETLVFYVGNQTQSFTVNG